MSITISLCMIVKNEGKRLKNCLESVNGIFDEINVTDTGSTDNTIDIAKQYTEKIFHFNWIDDFSAARNYSFSKATKDYIFWLDADDTITAENRNKLIKLKKSLSRNIDYVIMPYHYAFDDDGKVVTLISRERLVKRSSGFKWIGAVHETLNIAGNALYSDIYITHNNKVSYSNTENPDASFMRNYQILEKTIKHNSPSWRDLYYYGTSCYALGKDDEALDIFNRLFNTPNNGLAVGTDAYISAHKLYLKKGDKESALKVLTDSERLLNDKSEFYCTMGSFYIDEKKYDIACECFYKALSCKGNDRENLFVERNEDYYYFIPLNKLGQLFYMLKMYPEALAFFEKSLAYNPRHEKTISVIERLKQIVHPV